MAFAELRPKNFFNSFIAPRWQPPNVSISRIAPGRASEKAHLSEGIDLFLAKVTTLKPPCELAAVTLFNCKEGPGSPDRNWTNSRTLVLRNDGRGGEL
jgi:hypothetical protein